MTDQKTDFPDRVIVAVDQAISHWRTGLSEPARAQLSIHDMSALRARISLSVEIAFIEEQAGSQNSPDSGDLDLQSEPPRSPSHDELATERAEETSADQPVVEEGAPAHTDVPDAVQNDCYRDAFIRGASS